MPTEYSPYLFLVVFMIVAVLFAVLPLALARLWAMKYSPAKPGTQKNATYECGLETKGETTVQFKSEYYLYGLIFLVFDVETLFLLPLRSLFWISLTVRCWRCSCSCSCWLKDLAWAWMKGILTWK